MDGIMKIYNWVVLHYETLLSIVAHLCLAGSIIVKLTPTLKDDNYFKVIIKFIGKYVALDKYGPGPDDK